MNVSNVIKKNIDVISETKHNNDNIYLFIQFYIDNNINRYNEIKDTLKKNIKLNIFTNIILLNEKIYTNEELGLTNEEMKTIKQIDVKKRLTYAIVILVIKLYKKYINGYIVIANNDILFDNSLLNIRHTSLSKKSGLYALSRFEYSKIEDQNNLELYKLDAGSSMSQDTWIFHTNFVPLNFKLFDFELGRLGCDNRIAYLFWKSGYTVYNEPYIIKTYHIHSQIDRDNPEREKYRIKNPYLFIEHIERNYALL